VTQAPDNTEWLPRHAEEEPSAGLEAIRARIAADLVVRQGRFRSRSMLGNALPVAAALVAATGFALLNSASREWMDLPSVVMALLGAALAGGAAGVAPSRPGLSERLSVVALVAAAGALSLEIVRGVPAPFTASSALVCALSIVVGAAVPTLALAVGVVRSGLPARPLHGIAVAGAGMLAAGAVQWRHCALDERWHLAIGHVGIPLVASLAAAVLVARLTRPAPLPP
jgi:hypothetical protein